MREKQYNKNNWLIAGESVRRGGDRLTSPGGLFPQDGSLHRKVVLRVDRCRPLGAALIPEELEAWTLPRSHQSCLPPAGGGGRGLSPASMPNP